MSNINLKVGVLASHKGSLLLIKEINSKDRKYYWNIIKGTFDLKKDIDLLATARREALEEAGVKISIKGFLGVMTKSKKDSTTIQINLIATLANKNFKLASKSEQHKENEDICEVKFFTKNDLKKIKKGDFMNERAFVATREWLEGKKSDISRLKYFS
jgi:ADP-ribose pyrophosphatase YjhB (NUDIX family)